MVRLKNMFSCFFYRSSSQTNSRDRYIMESEPKQEEIHDKLRQNYQALFDVYNLIAGWDKEFCLMVIPSIPVEVLDIEGHFTILNYIIRLGMFVLMMLSRIQTFCATLFISSRPPQRHKPAPYIVDSNRMNVLKNLPFKERIIHEFLGIKRLSDLLKEDNMAFNSTIGDFRVPETMIQMNPDAKIQEFMEKMGNLLFYFSYVQGKISQLVCVYQQFLSKECTFLIKRPNPPDSVISSGKRLKINTNDM